jgi:hypothetical protein
VVVGNLGVEILLVPLLAVDILMVCPLAVDTVIGKPVFELLSVGQVTAALE